MLPPTLGFLQRCKGGPRRSDREKEAKDGEEDEEEEEEDLQQQGMPTGLEQMIWP